MREPKYYSQMTAYRRGKANAQYKAIEWQADARNHAYSWEEVAEYQAMFYKLAQRFGLVREFRENGII